MSEEKVNNTENPLDISPELFLGEMLKKRREQLNMEVGAVSSYLRLKNRDVEAIENGDFASVTKHLYIPGLIRSYAKFLKVNSSVVEEKIKLLPLKSNVENKKYQLINLSGENNLSPNKDSFFNFLLISILLFLILLSLYNSYESRGDLITNQDLVEELKRVDL